MTDSVEVLINDRWPIRMPPHRAERPAWPYWEAARLAHMSHYITPDDVIYDIGSEEGDMSALFASWVPQGGIVLFEPNPKVWPCIKLTFEANRLMPMAWFAGFASDKNYVPETSDVENADIDGWPLCAYGPLIPGHGFRHIAEHAEVTPSVALDDFMHRSGIKPTVITADIEGGELHMLRGAQEILSQVRPKVWLSIHPQFMKDLYREDAQTLYDLMESYGYERTFLATDHEVHEYFEPG